MKTVEWYKNNSLWWKPLKEKLARENKGFWSWKKIRYSGEACGRNHAVERL